MFDRFIETPRKRRQPWLLAVLTVSVLGHLGAVTALLIAGMWQLEKLSLPRGELTIAVAPTISAPPPLPRASEKKPPSRTNRPTRAVTQPSSEQTDDAPDGDEVTAHVPSGQDGGRDGGDPDGLSGGRCVENCLTGIPVAPQPVPAIPTIEPPLPPAPKTIPPRYLDGRRIAGEAEIYPPSSVVAEMMRAGESRLQGSIKMCLDRRGVVTRVAVLESTGHPAYDHKLVTEMTSWRYQPYLRDGEPIPVCTPINFVYVLKR